MIEKKGTHGTSLPIAEKIQEEGFKLSSGRGGKGVYFWRKSKYSKELAIGWYQFRCSCEKYETDNNTGAVIYVKMITAEDEVLNLENADIKDKITQILDELDLLPHPTDDEIAAVHDLFVEEIEKSLGKKIKILELRVGVPTSAGKFFYHFYDMRALGAPICYISRDPDIIDIEKVEEIR